MKIGFNKEGLTINSKKFDPLNLTVKGHGIESDRSVNDTDPFQMLETLSAAKGEELSKADKIKLLRTVLKK